jgi:hydroxypyruvate reductase
MAYPARVLGLVLSDVVGNELESIASGPTIPPGSSLQDTWAIVAKYDLQKILPSSVLEHLKPLRPGEGNQPPELPAIANRLIGSNRLATEAACALSEELGYKTVYLGDDWQGEARETGKRFAHRVTAGVSAGATCFIAGGETTVVVRGRGKGGRNQEVALAAAMTIEGKADTVISAFATDGVDGPTDAAGAIVTGDTIAHARRCGLDPEGHLDNNNTYPFFSCLGDLIITGPTGTNVNDLLFGLVYKANGTMQQAQPAGLHT